MSFTVPIAPPKPAPRPGVGVNGCSTGCPGIPILVDGVHGRRCPDCAVLPDVYWPGLAEDIAAAGRPGVAFAYLRTRFPGEVDRRFGAVTAR